MELTPETSRPSTPPPSRLLVVTNRLPYNIKQDEAGNFTFSSGAGGLTSALLGLFKTTPFQWFGWPGSEISEESQDHLAAQLREDHQAIPVYLTDKLSDLYYNKFANSILWPIFHYHPGEATFSEEAWQAYKSANRIFAQTVAKEVKEGDLVWIHDYHLMLVPAYLREEVDHKINFKIGFFCHTTFPSSEIYRILPVRVEILRGLLQSDLVGFHTVDYARHFLSSCWMVLGVKASVRTVVLPNRVVSVGAFPIGISPDIFNDTLNEPDVQQRIAELDTEFKDIEIMIGVDRLDYVKGVPEKLRAFEILLERNPEWIGRVVLIQVAIPTRGDVEEYQNLRTLVNELVGRINGKFGTYSYTPIHFMHQSVDFKELLALYAAADACIVASTRDGMNLVSFEYVACQAGRHGSLILSEFAGSAQNLSGAIIVNPWNTDEMARAMLRAVTMSELEREERWYRMIGHVRKNTSAFWAESFVRELGRAGEEKKPEYNFLVMSHDPLPTKIDWRDYDGGHDSSPGEESS